MNNEKSGNMVYGEGSAVREGNIEGCDLIFEIYPILKDFFAGEIVYDGGAVRYKLPNGQSFVITAQSA